MSRIEIEIVDDNPFNEGWLRYLLGLDRPEGSAEDEGTSPLANGWDMGAETRELRAVRHVFTRQHDIERPQYIVRAGDALPEKVAEVTERKFPKITDEEPAP